MLRGLATVNYWADDLQAAKEWYSELLRIDPYFERAELDGRIVAPGEPGYDQARPAYLEFRLGDYQHELGLIDSRYAPASTAAGPAGAIVYWHVDDLASTFEQLLSMGATGYQAPIERGQGRDLVASQLLDARLETLNHLNRRARRVDHEDVDGLALHLGAL